LPAQGRPARPALTERRPGVGFVFMTWLHSRFARVNTAVLFIAPLVAIAKVVFDRVESLKRAGALLGQ
jgi:hypothetical protein